MLGLDPQLQAIIEILLLLSLSAFVGWIVGRLVLSGQFNSIRLALSDKEAELEECLAVKAGGPQPKKVVEPEVDQPLPDSGAFVHADPLLPALTYDDTPELITAEPEKMAPVISQPDSETETPVDTTAPTDNSEDAVLSRIAARASEVNFDRIGRATATEADDLKDIIGIGPFLERKLHSLGIYTFRQIASFNKEDTAKINELIEFFPGRIDRDNWVEQAEEFHGKKYGDRG